MPDLPESVTETAAPEQLMQALEIFRQRYQQGLMTAREFREMLNLFQFTDEVGHLWSPGANTGQWYRWDRSQWTAAAPPARLKVPPALSASPRVQIPPAQPASSPPVQSPVCAGCGNPLPEGAGFCPKCGRPVSPAAPPPPTPQPQPRPPVCAHCGNVVPAGARFCAHCGQEVSIPAPPSPMPGPRRCPNPQCGQLVAPGKQFCTVCGTRME